MATARVAASGAFGSLRVFSAALAPVVVAAALAHGARAAAQATPPVVGTWISVARAAPDPLPLKDASRRAPATAEPKRETPPELAPPAEPLPVPERENLAAPPPCAVPGMPALLDTRAPVEITQQGDHVRMRYTEWGDATRTVYMNPRNGPPTQKPSPFGVSFGRWEGHTLAIFTTYIASPYFDRVGTPLSAAVTVLERYTPSADRSRLEWQVTVTDVATFTKPVVSTGSMAAGAAAPGATPAAPLVASSCVG